MKNQIWAIMLAACLFHLSLASAIGDDYSITWSTMDDGGGRSAGGQYVLHGTIGQPDAGAMATDDFALMGGFWGGAYDCIVNMEHLSRFAAEWLSGSGSPADLNNDGAVDMIDFSMLANLWLQYCPGDWPL